MKYFDSIISTLNSIIWSPPFILLCIVIGLYFTYKTKLLQVRNFKDMVQLLFKEGSNDKGVSPFQAFSMAIAGRVGTGNIAGVATAIAFGGPGAIFWMWVIAFFGSATAYIESALAQIYKVEKNGEYVGGPAYYIEKGLGKKWYAVLFAIVTIVSCALFLPGVQSNSIANGLEGAFNFDHLYTGIGVAIALALIVFGGAKRIGKFAEVIVPFMAGAYILMALIIMFMNFEKIPEVFSLIISSAFGVNSTFGGILGSAVSWGIKRGIYSNEAGQGTAPHAAAAAATSHPAKQGLVQAFSVYIDTLFVCSATAFMILFTGQYNVYNDEAKNTKVIENSKYIIENLPSVEDGPAFTQGAISYHFPAIGSEFVGIALLLFAFTTAMAYYFIAESNLKYIDKTNNKFYLWTLRVVFLASIIIGSINTGGSSWAIGDIGVGLMAWLNLIAIFLLRKPALLALEDYRKQKKEGKDPKFDPEALGIKNTSEWNDK
ncbi:alanine:cation symporter family protein [Paenimyroides tangerinum]|uniref:Alanine:cation symporter family protein n=1 Tax=Paenimyroides tangerinum TaxID=2488728 RepID=A0A3P3WDI6_9FLAO|nr:alanine/glycine:cation symporter family protein [Paenimyroides tangerinum]RRJ93221.1 alanine:cation symporter family protein [Paenimyroides tangerinum]